MTKNLTKKAIKASFIHLLNERSLDKISVKDIVEDCGISRNTFYYHYLDVYDLFDQIFEEVLDEIFKPQDINQDRWENSFIQACQYAMDNKKAVLHIYNSVKREQLETYLLKIFDQLMHQYVQEQSIGLNISDEDFYFIVIFYKHALTGMIVEWLQNDMRKDPEYIIKKLSLIFSNSCRYILENISHESHM